MVVCAIVDAAGQSRCTLCLLDKANFQGRPRMIRTVVDIDGMMCGMCESHVNDAVRNNFKVKKVSSSHGKGRTVIESEAPLDEDELRRVIGTTGYEVQQITSEEVQKKGLFGGLFGK